MSELNRMTIAQARKGMAEGSFSSVEKCIQTFKFKHYKR